MTCNETLYYIIHLNILLFMCKYEEILCRNSLWLSWWLNLHPFLSCSRKRCIVYKLNLLLEYFLHVECISSYFFFVLFCLINCLLDRLVWIIMLENYYAVKRLLFWGNIFLVVGCVVEKWEITFTNDAENCEPCHWCFKKKCLSLVEHLIGRTSKFLEVNHAVDCNRVR